MAIKIGIALLFFVPSFFANAQIVPMAFWNNSCPILPGNYAGGGTSGSPWTTTPVFNSCYMIRTCNTLSPAGAAWSTSSGTGQDGIYTIKISGASVNVYCDMTTDSGGWTRVVGINASNINHSNTAGVSWTSGNPQSDGKLSDAQINTMRSSKSSTQPVLRFVCGSSTAYFPGACTFNASSNQAVGSCLSYSKTFASPTWSTAVGSDSCSSPSFYSGLSSIQIAGPCAGFVAGAPNITYRRVDWRGSSYDQGCSTSVSPYSFSGAVFVR